MSNNQQDLVESYLKNELDVELYLEYLTNTTKRFSNGEITLSEANNRMTMVKKILSIAKKDLLDNQNNHLAKQITESIEIVS